MSGGPRVRSMNLSSSDDRPVLVPAGNKSRTPTLEKPATKPYRKIEKSPEIEPHNPNPKDKRQLQMSVSPEISRNLSAPSSILRQHGVGNQLLRRNLSMNASCSSDASTDSCHSRASTGRMVMNRSHSLNNRRKQVVSKLDKVVNKVENDGVLMNENDGSTFKRRCAWVTSNTDPAHATFHDEEWGVPVHDDNKLFELLSLAVALAELTWPTILNKRNIFREVFVDFDPISVAKLNEKKISAPGSPGSTLLSELKLRNIVENARVVCKIIDEFGSFDKYIWGFTNQKPIVNKFRYPRQVPVKTPKADMISKDLVRRGFRGVGPTVVYSFMQAAGLTNDHLITCFRFQECIAAEDNGVVGKEDPKAKADVGDQKPGEDMATPELARAFDEISICSDGQTGHFIY